MALTLRSISMTVCLWPTLLSREHNPVLKCPLTQAPGLLRTRIRGPEMSVCFSKVCRSRLLSSRLTVSPLSFLSFTCVTIRPIRLRRVGENDWKSDPRWPSFESMILQIETGNPPLTEPHRGRQFTSTLGILPFLRQKAIPLVAGPSKFSTIPTRAAPFFLPGLTILRKLCLNIARPTPLRIAPPLQVVETLATRRTGAPTCCRLR